MKLKIFLLATLIVLVFFSGCVNLSTKVDSRLSVGDTGTDGVLSIKVVKYELVESYATYWRTTKAPEGAKYLFIYIQVTNIGKTKAEFPTIGGLNDPKLYYAGSSMQFVIGCDSNYKGSYNPCYSGYFSQYPGITKEGWIAYEVPAGIDLKETTLEINGVVWKFG